MSCVLSLCFFVLFFFFFFFSFIPFSIAITSRGKERAGLCAFRALVCFARDGLCLFPVPLGVKDWLRLVIVALLDFYFLIFIYFFFTFLTP